MFGLNAFGRVGAVVRSAFAAAADPDAVIKALFANNEQGVFFDYSDLTTMFQDRAGTTPVTADGQPVGLILDKSQGLVLGAELVDTANTAAGWTPHGTNTVVQDGSAVKITYVGGTDSQFGAVLWLRGSGGLSADLVAGKSYKITMEAMVTGGATSLKFADSLAIITTPDIQADAYSTHTWNAYKAAADPYIVFNGDFSAGEVVWIRNISVKEIAGNHAIAQNDAARPLYKTDGTYHWLQYDGVDDVPSTAAINFTGTDKVSAFFGISTSSSANQGIITNGASGAGSWNAIYAAGTPPSIRGSLSGDSGFSQVIVDGDVSGTKQVVSQAYDLAGSTATDEIKIRKNGSLPTQTVISAGPAGGGAMQNTTVDFGSFVGLALAGNMYSMILLGRLATTQEITDTETWVNGKTGAY